MSGLLAYSPFLQSQGVSTVGAPQSSVSPNLGFGALGQSQAGGHAPLSNYAQLYQNWVNSKLAPFQQQYAPPPQAQAQPDQLQQLQQQILQMQQQMPQRDIPSMFGNN